ncbi:universal stress protein [Psychroserpens ponticola]|uniref:Universal stress protein n=1 Tax=Psychroserpens ponticola TaxID=2932268 RepID=A0ABY7S0N5_9FLAO|nr:universal stress protein [Psychroserpens ponticola]WCO02853.1 universal stress protein [Psychroserpens ponticola]
MKKSILIPTDFSDNAWSAIVYALKLYSDVECTFYFLHSTNMRLSTMSNISNKLLRSISDKAFKELEELKDMAEISNANSNHEFKIILSATDLLDTLNVSIEKYNIDLVVMGTKGATGAKEFFFGSNTVHIIKKLKRCPVLIVPDEFDFIEPKQIAFPTDFNHLYDDKELDPLRDLAELYNSKILPVCILSNEKLTGNQEINMTQLEKHLMNYNTSFHVMPNYAKKTVEINDFIELLEINMLVMINYKHSFIERILKEPIIKKIGFHPLIPFLVIPSLS